MTTQPLYWLQQLREEVSTLQTIPLWGSPPSFPWQGYCDALKKSLEMLDLRLCPSRTDLLSPEHFLAPFGSQPYVISLQLSPLPGTIHWIVSKESMHRLTALLLAKQPHHKGFSDPRFAEGFYRYLLLQAAALFDELHAYQDLKLQFLENTPLPQGDALATDIELSLYEHTIPGRIIYSPDFHDSFSRHFKNAPLDILSNEIAPKIDLLLKLEAGSCVLSQHEWSALQPGDFVVLDRCSYDPSSQKGTFILSLKDMPLFKIKVKKTGIKILDYAFYPGEENMMDEDLSEGSMDFEDEPPYVEEDEDLSEDSEHLWEPEHRNPISPETLFQTKEIPLQVVVEVDRIHMNLQKVLQLQPGNVLELSARPEQGVYLTIHGKRVARAELIKIGDILGVKILAIGDKATP